AIDYPVGRAAGIAGVTVRALHHYDEIGLLNPGGRSSAGYRRYDDADLERLQQILLYRELGFTLEEIATILDDPDVEARTHLRRQHALLRDRIARLQEMAAAVEYMLEAQKVGMNLTAEEKLGWLGGSAPAAYPEEGEQGWGETAASREPARRTSRYSKDDWARIQQETDDLLLRWIAAYDAGTPAESQAAMDL